jgi:hypothetical protein
MILDKYVVSENDKILIENDLNDITNHIIE